MKAIEILSKTDKLGNLKIKYNLNVKNRNVRVLILVDDVQYESHEEQEWLKSISNNPSFDFLNDPAEDIYSKSDGEALDV